MEKSELIERISREKLIVIVRGIENKYLIPMAQAMYAGGVRILEVTYAADGSIPAKTTAEGIRMLKEHFGDHMSIGAGTVLTPAQVALTAQAGGEFIISPDVNAEVIVETVGRGLVSIPGALTPTEAQAAHRAGADFVKLFPVTSLGPAYVKAIRAPLSHIRFLAVGGIDESNMRDYLRAGIRGFGIGSNIVKKDLIEAQDFEGVTALAKAFLASLREAEQ